MTTLVAIGLFLVAAIVFIVWAEKKEVAAMPPDARQRYLDAQRVAQRDVLNTLQHGPVKPAMVCPHCETAGQVRTQPVKRKKGVSGAKATGAVLTAGVSLIATGLSRKECLTEAYCGNCECKWDF